MRMTMVAYRSATEVRADLPVESAAARTDVLGYSAIRVLLGATCVNGWTSGEVPTREVGSRLL